MSACAAPGEHALLKKAIRFCSGPKADVFAFIEVLRVAPAARERHQEQDRKLFTMITAIFAGSRGTYGTPRVHRALRQRGQRVSRRRVARLVRAGGLRGRVVRV